VAVSGALERLAAALSDRYRIERELGQGGMATVYLAEDIKHRRQVAIKVLRPELAAALGPERFLREIETTANLRHPHILPLFDSGQTVGRSDGQEGSYLFYVMPFIEGESLRDRLTREKQLPIDEALRLAREVADALGYAHERGVIHRDIKPENILLERGHAVVADFGIARAIDTAGGAKLTETGLAVGTPTYMSPEQSVGEGDLDGRSDLYALGCVLYEMLAGEPPYSGPTAQAIIAKRFREPVPRISTVRETVPASLEAALNRVLAKSPADRFATAGEFAARPVSVSLAPRGLVHSRRARLAVGAVALLAVAVAGAMLLRPQSGGAPPVIGRTIQVTRDPGLEVDPALSPDGAMIAYAQGPVTRMQIYVQQISGGRRVALTSDSTDSFRSPKWSPDGTRIAFQGNDGIFIVPALGGAPGRVVRIDTATVGLGSGAFTELWGLAWAPDGSRLAYTGASSGLSIVPVAGGASVRLVAPGLSSSPAWSPDGTRLAVESGNAAFTFGTGYFGNVGSSSIWVVPIAGGALLRITDDQSLNTSPQWSPDGRALYWVSDRGGSRDIYRVTLDRRGGPATPPQRLTTGLDVHGISLASDGSHLAYSSFRTYSNIWSIAVPRSGPVSAATARPVTSGSQTIEDVDVSPDGRWLVFDSDRGGNPDLYTMPASGGEALRLTTDSAGDFSAAWSGDGKRIVFHSLRSGNRDIFTMNADGTGLVQHTSAPTTQLDPDWGPGDSSLVFEEDSERMLDFTVLPLSGPESARRKLGVSGDFAVWSPTGEWIAYHATDGLRLVSPSGGPTRLVVDNARDGAEAFFVAWAPDGRIIYYLTRRLTGWAIRSIPVEGGASRAMVNFDDPSRQPTRYGFTTDGRVFYFTLGSNESDVWVMELQRQ
jgi:serine/threonine-protein kinase